MNDHQGKIGGDDDTKSPTGIAALSLLRTVKRRLNFWGENNEVDSDKVKPDVRNIVHNREVNSNDDTANDSDQQNYSPSERLYDLCSRYNFMTKNDTIVEPVLVASGIHQLVESRGDSWSEHRAYRLGYVDSIKN